MITSKRKRIIFCGNYRWWYPRWNYLDGDNESISNQEFFGLDYMKKNIFQSSDSDKERIAKNRMKLNRVIDNSEYVVRCNQGKTSNPTSGFEYENCPSSSYGYKTDIVGFYVDYGNVKSPDKITKNQFNDLFVRMGIGETESNTRTVLKSYGSKMVASISDEMQLTESWMSVCELYKKYLDGKLDASALKKLSDSAVKTFKHIESLYGSNVKCIPIDSYIDLCKEVQSESISYEKLKSIIGNKEWAKPIFKFNDGDGNWMKSESERSDWMGWVKYNFHVNRGLEIIWMILNDKRFLDYDKYIIGVMGINECFNIGSDCRVNQWGEYLWMSKYIKEGKLKFLPEHVDCLYSSYKQDSFNCGISYGN